MIIATITVIVTGIAGFLVGLAVRDPVEEELLAEACDKCHWARLAPDQERLDEKCKDCLIGSARK